MYARMNNLEIRTVTGDTLIHVHYDKRRREWYAKRARDGAESPRYRDLGVLAEDLREAGSNDHYWEEPLLREPVPPAPLAV